MAFNDRSTTNKLLLILVLPILFYSLQILSFIFIPLMFAVFIALLFTPMMRWMQKRRFPKVVALSVVISILILVLFSSFKLIQLSSLEINAGKEALSIKFDSKMEKVIAPFSDILGIERSEGQSAVKDLLNSSKVGDLIFDNVTITFSFIRLTIVNTLMTLFFLVLFLSGSINVKNLLQTTFFKGKTQTVKTFMKVEKSISQFLKVKIFVSLLTGIAFGIIAWSLGISFPLFWGLLAFIINFVQMVGSVISTVLVMVFAYVELESPGTLLLAGILFTGAQVLFGAVLEPIFMGKSFSINIIVVLVMLMFWGFLWGIAGLVLAIPLTVLLKIILSEYPGTAKYADLMS